MAVYKVPQDVEAEDKLIGPFSFRQFVYLIIALVSIAMAWGLSQLFLPLAVIPIPLVIFFGALALPLRKDQPMEIYLAAVVSFYLKPRKRLWQPDGIQSLVEITAPKIVEVQRAKNLTETEAERRLSYLADIVDTGGWAVRGVETAPASSMQPDAFYDAQQAEDILDNQGGVSRSFDAMISQSDAKRRQEMVSRMRQQSVQAPPRTSVPDPYAALTPVTPEPEPHVTFNPYPTSIHQTVINPLSSQPPASQPAPQPQTTPSSSQPTPAVAPAAPPPQTASATTSEKPISPDIINLANNPDLSIETIAHEANRIHQKEKEHLPDDEVVISLR
ncbi:PrgI family protein [Streptomyces caniscabiei]|uniref:PrgI family protein n=1 Tax=Streptomyces caniscabiei TaxID=2746961 RepID=UPI0029A543FB|nr:PrgI family protein [Streptomyces caniscabiei]MDX2776387.1 PrgI family protein [Streptomyces caniscabiei]